MTLLYDKDGKEYKIPHRIDVKGWMATGDYTLEAPDAEGEVDYETPLNAYIETIEDEAIAEDFKVAVVDVTLEVKKDGTFNAKTIKELDAMVEELKA